MFDQVGSGQTIQDRRWSTKWRALSRWIFVCSAWSTVRCHRAVTRTTTVPVTRRASSTHTTLHSSPTWPTLSPTAPGPGGARSSATSSNNIDYNGRANVQSTQHWDTIIPQPSHQTKDIYTSYALHRTCYYRNPPTGHISPIALFAALHLLSGTLWTVTL